MRLQVAEITPVFEPVQGLFNTGICRDFPDLESNVTANLNDLNEQTRTNEGCSHA